MILMRYVSHMLTTCLVQITIVALIFVPIMMLRYTDVVHAKAEELVNIFYQVKQIIFKD